MGILYTLLMFGSYCIPSDNNSTMLTFAASVLGIALLVIHMIQSIKLAACFGKGRLYGVFLFCFGGIGIIKHIHWVTSTYTPASQKRRTEIHTKICNNSAAENEMLLISA